MSKPTLYSYWRSGCSWRVRIALNLKKIEYEYKAVHLVEGKQREQDYVSINPYKIVPTLVFDNGNVILCQSLAIMEYLEEVYPLPSLLPEDPVVRAKVREIMQAIGSDIQPLQNLRVQTLVGKLAGDDKKGEWTKHWIETGFQGLEQTISKTAGKYCVGDKVTFADICIVPQVFAALRVGVSLDPFPTIVRVNAALSELEEFKKAHPSVQPDAEK